MGKKAVKRSINNPAQADEQSPKKVKLNGKVPTKKTPVTNDAVVKSIAKKKKVKPENGVKNEAMETAEKKPSVNVVKKEKLKYTTEEFIEIEKEKKLAKKKKLLEKKKKELIEKNEKRKLKRQQDGQYKPEQIQKSQAEIEAKIVEMKSRPELTKTAIRKLAVLQKKLKILDGTFVAKAVSVTPTLTETEKRKLRKKKLNLKLKAAAAAAGGVGEASEESESKPVVKKDKLAQQGKKEKVEQKIKSEDEEEEEEEEQEEEEEEENTDDSVEDDEENEETSKPVVKENKKKQQAAQKPANPEKETPNEKKTRFVLFVGNIAHGATEDDVKNHFLTKCSAVKDVRLPLTADNKPKGIAFVELNNKVDYEKALCLHLSILNGRKINVEYSAHGSKKDGKQHQAHKNQKLHFMRKNGKLAGSTNDSKKRNARRNKNKPE